MCDQGLLVGLYVQDYKSLCTAVTTYATLVANLVTAGLQVPETLHISTFVIAYKPMTVGQGDLLFCVRSGFGSGSSQARLQVSESVACTDNADISIFYDVLKTQ